MKRGGPRIEVAVKALVVRRGRVLLLKRRRDARPAPGGWDTPGGRLEFGESLEEALQREVREELGPSVSLNVRQVLNAWTFEKDRRTQLVGITFLCDLAGRPQLPDDSEHVSFEWIPAARALRDPAIGDSLRRTIAAAARRRR